MTQGDTRKQAVDRLSRLGIAQAEQDQALGIVEELVQHAQRVSSFVAGHHATAPFAVTGLFEEPGQP
ncbi:MAG: hypothetical protein FWD29_01545 [Micrococcales bacterium]|nr:hypothetical protein [Micrococcales bacterium]